MHNEHPNRSDREPAATGAPRPAAASIAGHLYTSVVATIALAIILCGIYPAIVWGVSQLPGLRNAANGSMIRDAKGTLIGSEWIGQNFTADKYFHPRPSAAGNGYDSTSSSGSNLAPTSAKLFLGAVKTSKDDKGNDIKDAKGNPVEVVDVDGISDRLVHYCADNKLPYESSQPLATFNDASGSLDDVRLIKAFNDDKAPLKFVAKTPIPADAVTGSGSGLDPHISVANAMIQANRIAAARSVDVEKISAAIDRFTDHPTLGLLGDPAVNVLKLNMALDADFPVK